MHRGCNLRLQSLYIIERVNGKSTSDVLAFTLHKDNAIKGCHYNNLALKGDNHGKQILFTSKSIQ